MASIFLQLAKKVLLEEKRSLTSNEIWDLVVAKGLDKNYHIVGQTPVRTMGASLYIDVRDNPNSEFITVGIRPKRFSLKSLPTETTRVEPPPILERKPGFLEKDLHPFMVYFGSTYLNANLKTIRHNKSEKRDFGEWVHPDLVGCYFPFKDWENEVVEVSAALGNSAVKIYSFEMKRELGFGNLREAFFQAVSNSSWANEGYLVAAIIDSNEEFLAELKRLSSSFGIGVIHLNIEDPDSSQIIVSSIYKEYLDWETVNKLAKMNVDFSDFLKRVKTDLMSREVRKEWYDKVLEKEDLIAIIKK